MRTLAGTANQLTQSFTYTPDWNQLATATDARGKVTRYFSDAKGRLIEVRDPLGNSTRVEYNPQGLVSRVLDPRNQATQFAYDLNDLASVIDPLGRTMRFFTDSLGRVLQVTDPLGNKSSRTWDKLHRVLTTTDAQGNRTAFAYDYNGNLTSFTDPRGGITGWTLDAKNRVSVRTDPLGRTESFTWDAEDNLLTRTDRKGQITTHSYDELSRRTLTTWHGGATTAFTWDAGDRLTLINDAVSGSITRSYDNRFDTPVTEVAPLGAGSTTLTTRYDAAGRRTQMQVTGQTAVTYGYDDANRITAITQGANAVGFTYDAASRRTQATLPNGVTIDYGYDNANQLTSLTYKRNGIALGDLSYTYDAAGRRKTMGGSFARVNLPPALTSATYDAANKLTHWAGTALTYDNNGNLVSDGSRTHTWDTRDRLTGLVGGGITASHVYDAFDRRISRTLNGTQLGTVWDGQREAHTATGSTIDSTLLNGPGLDERYARTQGINTHVILPDALGSTLQLVSPGGSLTATYTYEPYGTATQSGPDNTQYRYTGREDDGTGLMYYRARYYNPRIGRFISEDPIGLAGGVNTYA